MPKKPDYELSQDSRILRVMVREMIDAGATVITYQHAADKLRRSDSAELRARLRSAINWYEREHDGVVFVNVAGSGYRRAEPNESPELAQSGVAKARRGAVRTLRKLGSLAPTGEGLDEDAMNKLFVRRAQLAATVEATSTRAAKSIASKCRSQSAELPSVEVFRALI